MQQVFELGIELQNLGFNAVALFCPAAQSHEIFFSVDFQARDVHIQLVIASVFAAVLVGRHGVAAWYLACPYLLQNGAIQFRDLLHAHAQHFFACVP